MPAASLLRAHYAFYAAPGWASGIAAEDPCTASETWGQSKSRQARAAQRGPEWQVDLLQHVREYFGTCVNGKLTLQGNEPELPSEKRLG